MFPGAGSQRMSMTKSQPMGNAESLINNYRAYALAPYREILAELLEHAGPIDTLKDKKILEIGPGNRVNLMRFFSEEMGIEINGVGRAPLWPWTPHRQYISKHITNTLLLDHLPRVESQSYDIIYSRHVMEQHSIHAGILLTSRTYWRYIRENRFKIPGEDFPSSLPNIQAIFRHCYRTLKPGGIIISQIGRRQYSALDRPFLESLNPQTISERPLGKMSLIVAVTKSPLTSQR